MSTVVAKDNGTELSITITDDEGFVDLTSVDTVTARFVRGDRSLFDKILTVTDALNGECHAVLTREDLVTAGTYKFQITVTFHDDKEFSSLEHRLLVSRRI